MVNIRCCNVKILSWRQFLGLHREIGTAFYALMREACWKKMLHFFSYLKRTIKFKIGYIHHPNVTRFRKRIGELIYLHDEIVVPEFKRRGYNHKSPLIIGKCTPKPSKFVCSKKEIDADTAEVLARQAK